MKKKVLKVFEGFAGYGGGSFALKRVKEEHPKFNYEIVGFSEIDKYAVELYNANHRDAKGNLLKNFNDITQINPYLMKHISLQEGNFALNKESIPLLRNQIAGEKDYYRWGVMEYIRYFALISNINIMSYRHVFEKMGDVSQMAKDVYMMIDLWRGGAANGEETRK